MEKTLQLVFRNDEGTLFTISLANSREDITEAGVTAVMDSVLAKNIFDSTGGALVSKVRARIVSREVVDIVSYS
jgi:hypothetical protein